jgi:PAS domain S-box-containing protein
LIDSELALAVLAAVEDAVVVIDQRGLIQGLNPSAEAVFGWAASDLLGGPVSALMPSPWREQHDTYLSDYLRTGVKKIIGQAREVCGVTRDGTLLQLEIRIVELKGSKPFFAGILRDISSRKRKEEELRAAHDRAQHLFDLARSLIVVCDIDGRVTGLNKRCLAAVGRSREELLGRDWFGHCVPLAAREQSRLQFHRLVQAEVDSDEGYETPVLCRDGRVLTVVWRRALLRDSAGQVTEVVSYGTDLTGHKSLEDALLEATRQAEEASRAKSAFLANMSHELRTPLNSVLGFSELLQQEHFGSLTARQVDYVAAIHDSGSHLLKLVNDVLDVSKVEAGRLELERRWVDPRETLSAVLRGLQPLAGSRNVAIVSQVDEELEQACLDPLRLRQILFNLLSNGIKFSHEGGRLELRLSAVEDGVRIVVRDWGVGIASEDLPRLFLEFEQLGELSARAQGTGLGLALTRRLVLLHGGTIEVESELGQGSTFSVVIPNSSQGTSPSGALARERVDVLVYEENEQLAELLAGRIKSVGLSAVRGPDQGDRVAFARELRPRLITLDLRSPESDWETLRLLRAEPATAETPVVVISDYLLEAPDSLSEPDDYLIKPVDRTTFLESLARVGVEFCALQGAWIGLLSAPGRLLDRIRGELARAGCHVWTERAGERPRLEVEAWVVLAEAGASDLALLRRLHPQLLATKGRVLVLTDELGDEGSGELSQLRALRSPELLVEAVHALLLREPVGFSQALRSQLARSPGEPVLLVSAGFEGAPPVQLLEDIRTDFRGGDFVGVLGGGRAAVGLPGGSSRTAERFQEMFRAHGCLEGSVRAARYPLDAREPDQLLVRLQGEGS